jgi:dipeptidyl aminopeptidase/acylaminoacyl peptidase
MNDPASAPGAPTAVPGATSTAPAPDPTATRAPAPARRPMRDDDLLRFVWIADPRISPDGTRVAFTKVWIDAEADAYRTQLWLADGDAPPRPLTSGVADSQPRWSPDGARLAFVRSPGPKQPGQIFVLRMDGGEAEPVCDLAKGASDPAWSPDGARLAFLSATNPALDVPEPKKPVNEPARVVTRPVFRENDKGFIDYDRMDQVWVVDVPARGAATPRQLTTGPYAASAPGWSRDGKRILFLCDRRDEPWFGNDRSVLYAVDPDLDTPTGGGALETVVDFGAMITSYAEHADGRIAMIGYIPREPARTYEQPRLFLAEGPRPIRTARDLSAGCDDDIGGAINSDQHPPRGGGQVPLAFSADGRSVLVRLARHGSAMLAALDVEGRAVRPLTPAGHDLVAGTASADGRTWALTIGSATTPGDLHRFDAATGALTKLWGPNDALLAEVALGEVEEFWYPSFDGQQVQAWLVKPPGFDPAKRHPLLLEIHGGPHTAYGWGFFHEFHLLAGAGYVVLYGNPRGSTSYGQAFADVIQYKFPGDDARDLLASVDAAIARGFVDEKRLGVTGGSAGGLLTNWIVAQTDRFAAAVTQRCVSDWPAFYYSADFAMFTPFWFRRAPWEDPAEYQEHSPVMLAERITTPLMVIHSEEDWRTPIGQGEAMFRALKRQRKTAVMVRFPGESHELSRSGMPSRRVQNQKHIRAWFDRWILGVPAPDYGV